MISLGHVNIRTTDLERSVAFYRDIIGLKPGPAATRPDSEDHVWMHSSEGLPCIHLQRATSAETNSSVGAGVHHVAFTCVDADSWRHRLSDREIEYSEARFDAAGLLQFNLIDPDGVRLELLFIARHD